MSAHDPYAWDEMAREDLIGMDRLSRAVMRVVVRLPPGRIVAVHGAPGSGKAEFLRRTAWLAAQDRARGGEGVPGVFPGVVWYRPWAWSKQGNILAGLVAAVARATGHPEPHLERARELFGHISRLRFDGRPHDVPGAAFTGVESDPVGALAAGFAALVQAVKAGRGGRMLIFIDEMDRLSPGLRWQLLDGLRVVLGGGAEANALVCIGREAALAAVRHRDGPVPDEVAERDLADVFDLTLTVPSLEIRRIGTLLRRYLAGSEATIRQSFGPEAILGLSAAVAHRPLGSPRFLERLANRVTLLAEYALEVRATRELSEAQWAWIIVSERWPSFRRFMIRGGRERWIELRAAIAGLRHRADPATRSTIRERLDQDLLLSDYLRMHADAFVSEAEAIFWLENLQLAAGL